MYLTLETSMAKMAMQTILKTLLHYPEDPGAESMAWKIFSWSTLLGSLEVLWNDDLQLEVQFNKIIYALSALREVL